VEVIPEQWLSTLQLLPKDFKKVLIGQVLRPTIWPARGEWR